LPRRPAFVYCKNPREKKFNAAFSTFTFYTWRARGTETASWLEAGRDAVILPPSTSLEKNILKGKSRDTGPLYGNININILLGLVGHKEEPRERGTSIRLKI
jgi:hypothetical protein